MKNEEKASISIMKIICISIILVLISGITTMAVNVDLKNVTIILQNGYEMTVVTSKSTVSEILSENNISLEDDQKTIPDLESEVSSGDTIQITDMSYNEVQIATISEDGTETSLDTLLENYADVTEKIVVEQVAIPYETITKNTTGTTTNTTNKVVQEGQDGIKEVTYRVKYQNDIEIEKTLISEVVVQEAVDEIIQVSKTTTSRSSTSSRTYTASSSELEIIWAIVMQEGGSSYESALAVVSTAVNRINSSRWSSYGSTIYAQLTAKGQYCYSNDTYWVKYLGGNVSSAVKQAVAAAMNGTTNHSYTCFRSASSGASGVLIGGNVYYGS